MENSSSNQELVEIRNRLIKYKAEDTVIYGRRKRVWILIAVLFIGAGIFGYYTIPRYQKYEVAVGSYQSSYVEAAAFEFRDAQINNSEEWASALYYALGDYWYEVDDGDSIMAVEYYMDSKRPAEEKFVLAAMEAIDSVAGWENYEQAETYMDQLDAWIYELGTSSYDDKIAELNDKVKYGYGKQLYEEGEYESARYKLEESNLSEAQELLSEIEYKLELADNEEWNDVCGYYDSDTAYYLYDLYNNTNILDECYSMFGYEKEDFTFYWNNDGDSLEELEEVAGNSEIYCHYDYCGREEITLHVVYVYDGNYGDYVFDSSTEPYDSGWYSKGISTSYNSGYLYAFFYNENSGEPLAATRVWMY